MESATAHARAPKQGRSRQSFERIIEATIDLLRERSYDQITLADLLKSEGRITELLRERLAGVVLEPASGLIALTGLIRE